MAAANGEEASEGDKQTQKSRSKAVGSRTAKKQDSNGEMGDDEPIALPKRKGGHLKVAKKQESDQEKHEKLAPKASKRKATSSATSKKAAPSRGKKAAAETEAVSEEVTEPSASRHRRSGRAAANKKPIIDEDTE